MKLHFEGTGLTPDRQAMVEETFAWFNPDWFAGYDGDGDVLVKIGNEFWPAASPATSAGHLRWSRGIEGLGDPEFQFRPYILTRRGRPFQPSGGKIINLLPSGFIAHEVGHMLDIVFPDKFQEMFTTEQKRRYSYAASWQTEGWPSILGMAFGGEQSYSALDGRVQTIVRDWWMGAMDGLPPEYWYPTRPSPVTEEPPMSAVDDLVNEFHPYTGPARRKRIHWPPRVIIVHATRGPTTPELQYRATVNWFTKHNVTRNRLRGWGPMADFVVGAQGVIGQFADWRDTRSNWATGYGGRGSGTFGADEWSIPIEFAQTDQREPMTEKCLERGAMLVKALAEECGIPVVRVNPYTQKDATVTGITGHDDTANGIKLGKSDPGWTAPEWVNFLGLVLGITPAMDSHTHDLVLGRTELTTGPARRP